MFGEPIKLTYKGDDSFKTNFGACLTLFFWICMVLIIAVQASTYLDNLDSNVQHVILSHDAIMQFKPFLNQDDIQIGMINQKVQYAKISDSLGKFVAINKLDQSELEIEPCQSSPEAFCLKNFDEVTLSPT